MLGSLGLSSYRPITYMSPSRQPYSYLLSYARSHHHIHREPECPDLQQGCHAYWMCSPAHSHRHTWLHDQWLQHSPSDTAQLFRSADGRSAHIKACQLRCVMGTASAQDAGCLISSLIVLLVLRASQGCDHYVVIMLMCVCTILEAVPAMHTMPPPCKAAFHVICAICVKTKCQIPQAGQH